MSSADRAEKLIARLKDGKPLQEKSALWLKDWLQFTIGWNEKHKDIGEGLSASFAEASRKRMEAENEESRRLIALVDKQINERNTAQA